MIEEDEKQLLQGVKDSKRALRIAHNNGDKIEVKFLAKMICKMELDIEILKMQKFLET
jgi:hypothetical protein